MFFWLFGSKDNGAQKNRRTSYISPRIPKQAKISSVWDSCTCPYTILKNDILFLIQLLQLDKDKRLVKVL